MIKILLEQHLFLVISTFAIILAACFCCQLPISAQEANIENEHFDGSEFRGSSYRDTNFEKSDFIDLHFDKSDTPQLMKKENDISLKPSEFLRKRRYENNKSNEHNLDKSPISGAEVKKIGEDRTGPVMDLPGDWVPDKLSLTSNGGFTIAPGSGSPVPYRLNGHVDIQRGRP